MASSLEGITNNYQSRLNQIGTTLAEIRAETVDIISRLVVRQSRIEAVDKSVTSLDSRCSDLQHRLEGF
jgi:predicted  nucleic acid-binding Zn-ribbon protein